MKKKDLYLPSGYLNMRAIYKLPYNFIFLIGARGIGKTYGALEEVVEDGIYSMYMRRKQSQADSVFNEKLMPFNELNRDKGWQIRPKKEGKYIVGFYETHDEAGKLVYDIDTCYCLGCALSTFSNVRGLDAQSIQALWYDEFIPETIDSQIKGEADAFLNIVESLNRNRELYGNPALKVICMSNSTNVANPIFIQLGIVRAVYNCSIKGEFIYEDKERGLCVIMPKNSPISKEKEDTALYRLTKGSSFYKSAIKNEYTYNVPTNTVSRPLQEYKPIVNVGEICVYQHKSKRIYYVSKKLDKNAPSYGTSGKELAMYQKRYIRLTGISLMGRVEYEDYACEILFDKYNDMIYN